MKKVINALLVAAAFLAVGCGPDNKEDEKKPITLPGIAIDQALITNRGDYYKQNNGSSNLVLRFQTLGNVDGEEMAVAYLTLELDAPLDDNGLIPEGTYSIANGDIYPGEVQNLTTGTFFVDFTKSTMEEAYMFASSGELIVAYEPNGDYNMTVDIKGLTYDGNKGMPYRGTFKGQPDWAGLGATNETFVYSDDFVAGEGIYIGATEDGSVALWDIVLYNEAYYELMVYGKTDKLPAQTLSFMLICDNMGPEALPRGTYPIDMLETYTNNTIISAYYTTISDYELKADESGEQKLYVTYDVNDYITDGNIKIAPNGNITEGNKQVPIYTIDLHGFGIYDGYKMNFNKQMYLMEMEQPGGNLVPIHFDNFDYVEALYWGEQDADETGSIKTKPLWQMQMMANNAEGANDKLIMIEFFTKDGNTFEQGIPSGDYNVVVMDETLDITQPNIVFPGYYDLTDDGYIDGIYGTYIVGDFQTDQQSGQTYFTMLYDCIAGGTMTVDNKGEGQYGITLNFTGNGNMTYSNITAQYDGPIDLFDGTAVDGQQQARVASKQNNHKIGTAKQGKFEIVDGSVDSDFVKPTKGFSFKPVFK